MRKRNIIAAAAAASFLSGGAAGATFLAPTLADAQTTPTTQPKGPATEAPESPRPGGARAEAVSDRSVAAQAIGISEADLATALRSGQSLAAIAKAHNVDPQKVIDALVADGRSELATAVSGGKLSQAQADQQTASLTQRVTDQVNGVGRHGPGKGPEGPEGPGGPGHPGGAGRQESVSDASVAAKAIGISDADLATAAGSGQSLAAIAKAHNVDPQKVIDALVADQKSELAASVSSGKLTQGQADQAMTNLSQRIANQVNGVGGHHG